MDIMEFAEMYLEKRGVKLYYYHRELIKAMAEGKIISFPRHSRKLMTNVYREYLKQIKQ